MKKGLLISVLVLAVAGYAITFLPLGFLQPVVERSIQRGLGRRVEIGEVHLALWNGPGVALDRVTIHEDPRAGLEPFAYAETVQARLDWLALLHGRLNFSSLRFADASLNLVKPNQAPWNFQMLLEGGGDAGSVDSAPSAAPAIRMRAGRVNLKFDQTKSVVYFDDVDLDVSSRENHVVDVRFSGVPARTDRPAKNLEHFFIQGTYDAAAPVQKLDLHAELEPSPLDAVARLFVPRTFPLEGSLAMTAAISGAPADLHVTGDLHLDTGAKWSYQGKLDLPNQQLILESVVLSDAASGTNSPAPAPIRILVWDLLSVPHWEATLEHAPLETFAALARRLGAPVPEKFTLEGFADGSLAYRDAGGIAGQVDLQGTALNFLMDAVRGNGRGGAPNREPGFAPVRVPHAAVSVKNGIAVLGPVMVNIGKSGSLELSGRYALDGLGAPDSLDLRITSHGLDLTGLDARMRPAVPLLQNVSQGIWRGSLRFRRSELASGAEKFSWTGDYDLLNARLALEGFAEPLRIQSLAVSMKPDRVDLSRLRASLGPVPLSGEYRWELASGKPHTFRLQTGDISAKDLERLFEPLLRRGGGFLARTLRLGSSEPPPDWLARRAMEGNISGQIVFGQGEIVKSGGVKKFTGPPAASDLPRGAEGLILAASPGGHWLKMEKVRVVWNGATMNLSGGRVTLDDALLTGQLRVDLANRAPVYHFAGKIDGAPYKAGRLDVDGILDAEGAGPELLSSLRAQGTFRGQGIAFSPEAEFKKAAGRFELRMVGGAPGLKLSGLEVTQGADTYAGGGATQEDGKLVLDLASGGRQVRYTGTPVSLLTVDHSK